jgi:hypothetical protein
MGSYYYSPLGGEWLIEDWLGRVSDRLVDLQPIALELKDLMLRENLEARLAGVDKDGQALAPLRHGRPLTPAEIRDRGGDGPPLAPRGAGSRVVTEFEVDIIPVGNGDIIIQGSWPRIPWLALHSIGAGRLPVRDIISDPIRPDMLADVLHAHAERIVAYP